MRIPYLQMIFSEKTTHRMELPVATKTLKAVSLLSLKLELEFKNSPICQVCAHRRFYFVLVKNSLRETIDAKILI